MQLQQQQQPIQTMQQAGGGMQPQPTFTLQGTPGAGPQAVQIPMEPIQPAQPAPAPPPPAPQPPATIVPTSVAPSNQGLLFMTS